MSGWYIVFLICCAINGVVLSNMGYGPNTWQFWAIVSIVILSRLSGVWSN